MFVYKMFLLYSLELVQEFLEIYSLNMFTQWEVMCTMSITEMKEWKRKKNSIKSIMHHKSYNPKKKRKIRTLTKWPIQEELMVSVA